MKNFLLSKLFLGICVFAFGVTAIAEKDHLLSEFHTITTKTQASVNQSIAFSVTPAGASGQNFPISVYCDALFSGTALQGPGNVVVNCPSTVKNIVFYAQSLAGYVSCVLPAATAATTACGSVTLASATQLTSLALAPTSTFASATLPSQNFIGLTAVNLSGQTTVSGCVTGAMTLSASSQNCVPYPMANKVVLSVSNNSSGNCFLTLNPDGSVDPLGTTCGYATSGATVTINSTTTLCTKGNGSGVGTNNNTGGANFNPAAKYGDYLSAQMKSLRKFGYGMFVVKMQAANGPTCSTFWLYADAPAPGAAPEISKLWRWNEFDIEFVPYTKATQNAYVYYNGVNNKPTYCGSKLFINQMSSGAVNQNSPFVSWVGNRFMTDDTVFSDMQHYYNRWMVDFSNPSMQIPAANLNFQGAVNTTGPTFSIGGSNPNAGWPLASTWKYPLTAVNQTPQQMMQAAQGDQPGPLNMVTMNWWRTPLGNQSRQVSLNGQSYTYTYVIHDNTPPINPPASMNNESYVFGGSADGANFDPYGQFNTYTIVWTPTRVSYYINAPKNGTDIDHATPVLVYDVKDYPSLKQSGTQAPQGNVSWVDTGLQDKLGHVSMNLANYVAFSAAKPGQSAGAGWSGNPPGPNFKSATAYFRSVQYYPLLSGKSGKSASDFASSSQWGFDLSDGSWNAANFSAQIANYFGILYAQDYTNMQVLRDSKSPLAITFTANASDGKPAMALTVTPSVATPIRRFFVMNTNMNTGSPVSASNPFMYATYTPNKSPVNLNPVSLGVSGVSTPLSFFAPLAPTSKNQGVSCVSPFTKAQTKCNTIMGTVSLYLSNSAPASYSSAPSKPNATAVIALFTDLNGKSWWSVQKDQYGILTTFQVQNPQLITVQPGTATPSP